MNQELRGLILYIVVSLVLIRFWIEVITTTILKNSSLINSINNNKIGYHHYQLGLIIILLSVLSMRFLPKWDVYINLALGFGIALFLDQYTYIFSRIGVSLPFEYRSLIDYLIVTVGAIVGLLSLILL